MKKVLVIGGAGYIGGLTTDVLISSGYDVTVYDKLLYEKCYQKDCKFIYGDVRDTAALQKISSGQDEIVWLAAIVGDGACAQDPALTKAINTDSIRNFIKKTKRKIIFTSTCSVYGAQDGLLTEKSQTNPLSVYAATKLAAEEYVLNAGGLVFRLGTLYGLGDAFSRIRLDLVVNILTLKAFRDNKIILFGGQQWRPLIAVVDVAHYLTEAVEKVTNDVFNVKYRNITLMNLGSIFKEIFPDLEIEYTDLKFEDLRNYRVSSKKAQHYFSYKPVTTIESEIHRMVKMFKDKRIRNFDDDIYYNTKHIRTLLESNNI